MISGNLNLPCKQISATLDLLEGGATIPFISRYRKEVTGGLDEVQIEAIQSQYEKLQETAKRKETILKTIDAQGKLTQELQKRIEQTWDATELEDIYLPYKPKRKTRASVAIARGLQPLADFILAQSGDMIEIEAEKYLTELCIIGLKKRLNNNVNASDVIIKDYLDDNIATCILVGMITDTGSFSHSIFKNTFSICGEILSLTNVNYKAIHQNIYDNSSENRLRLLGFLINDRMTVLNEYNTAYIYASKSDLERFDYQIGDTEGVVNYPLSISNIKMSVFITEKQGCIRLSFRSKGDFSVNDLTRKHFNGGGHLNAAGGTLECSLEKAIEKLVSVLPEYKELLSK